MARLFGVLDFKMSSPDARFDIKSGLDRPAFAGLEAKSSAINLPNVSEKINEVSYRK